MNEEVKLCELCGMHRKLNINPAGAVWLEKDGAGDALLLVEPVVGRTLPVAVPVWFCPACGLVVKVQEQIVFELMPEKAYCGLKLPKARYKPDFVLTYADGTVEIVEVKSKFTRRMQRDYIYRRRLFIDLVAEPRGWKFTEWYADKED